MPHLHRRNVHVRLVVITLAFATWQTLGATGSPAQALDTEDYEAISMPPFAGRTIVPPPGQCDGRLDYGTGDDGCGSMTGGPSGGIAGRS